MANFCLSNTEASYLLNTLKTAYFAAIRLSISAPGTLQAFGHAFVHHLNDIFPKSILWSALMTQTRAKIMQNPSFSYPVSGIYKVPPETPPHPLKESPRNFGHQKCSKCLKNAVQRRKKSWGWTDAQALVAPNHLRPNLGNLGIFHHRRPPKNHWVSLNNGRWQGPT